MSYQYIANILKMLSDDKSLAVFDMVGSSLSSDSAAVLTRLGMTKKQYYWKMNQLIDAGLVKKKSDRYLLTSLGKIVYETQILIGKAVEDYWKLKAIDSIRNPFPVDDQKKMIDIIIEKNDIKNILLN
jgi:predicted transcriptional regulator